MSLLTIRGRSLPYFRILMTTHQRAEITGSLKTEVRGSSDQIGTILDRRLAWPITIQVD